jgi:type I restriction enzyme S subunit
MSALPKYERYKDSGIEWVGTIPAHWDVKPGRVTLALNKEKNTGNIEETVLSLSYGRLVIKPPEKMTGLVPESLEGYQIINPGDIIIRPTDLQNDWTSLRVGLAKDRGIITSAYLGLKHDEKVSSEYLYYLLHSYDLLKVYYGMGTGLRQNLSWDDFKYLPLTLPPKPDQDRIVAFLDRKTAEIDALIAKKQRQIELLDEQKAILINRAVTRGLNPNAKLKPSGIEWIGEIPEHWEVKKLRVILNAFSTRGSPEARLLSVTRELGVIERNVESKEENHNFVPDDLTNYKVVEKGDFVINKMKAWQGSFAVTPMDGIVSPAYFTYRVSHVTTDFFHVAIRSKQYVPYFAAASDGVRIGQWDLVPARMREIQFVIPPVKEQSAIAGVVEKIKMDTASLILKIESQIDSLKTLRSTLIAHSVTGSIKV